ncbi:hypothetical protein GCM10008967_28060 [Bacillus carboniphilus]|uniref:Uncharacterized protein n=1 Tax=Bacillus carboniphilus TaxID=86663 RepID=A0ABP3G4T8_9BACI
MERFESFSFVRKYRNQHIEFFNIVGLKHPDEFVDAWDGRGGRHVGYVMFYTPEYKTHPHENFVYIIKEDGRDYLRITRYSKQFVYDMQHYLTQKPFEAENCTVLKTDIQREDKESDLSLMKRIITNDVPWDILYNVQ